MEYRRAGTKTTWRNINGVVYDNGGILFTHKNEVCIRSNYTIKRHRLGFFEIVKNIGFEVAEDSKTASKWLTVYVDGIETEDKQNLSDIKDDIVELIRVNLGGKKVYLKEE